MKDKRKDTRAGYLAKNTFIFALGNVGTKFISFFLVPLYTYVLSAEDYGTIDLISTLVTLIVPVLSLNISEAIMRFALDENAEQNKIISAGVIMMFVATVGALLLFPSTALVKILSTYSTYIYFYAVSSIYSQILLSNLRGRELLLGYSIGNVIHVFFAAVLNILFLVVYKFGVEGYFLAYILSNVITAVYAFFAGDVGKQIRPFAIDRDLMRQMIKYSGVLIPTSFMWWIMNSLDRVMITYMIGVAASGIYAVAYKVPTMVSTLSSIFNQAWSYSAIKEKKSMDGEQYSNLIYDGLVSIVLVVAMGLLFILKPFMGIYVASEYFEAWRYTSPLIVGVAFSTLGSFVATPYTVNKDSVGFLKSGAIGALTNIVFNFALIPNLGVQGAALATCISYIAVFVFRVVDTRKYTKLNVINKRHILGYGILLLGACTVYLNNRIGQLLLCIEFACMIALFLKKWRAIVHGIVKKGNIK